MTKHLSREQFLRNLGESGLFTQDEISKTLEALPQAQAGDGEAVAQCLITAGKLTPFQAEAIRDRQFEGLVIGNYQVLDRLGAGGMGTVYKARHRRMKRVVAIKVLTRSAGQPAGFIERFQREVEAVSRLSHPNIVMAHDADEAKVGHFLVMEFVNGRDLASEVQKHGPLPVALAVDCIVQAARALEYAHGQGIIHRDIKPANLLRDQSGVVKVADLGLARFNEAFERAAETAVSALTQAGTIMGTADFMSPEQALALTTIDHRTDIYSLGGALYFLLVGRAPYQGPSLMAILLKHREAPIPSLCADREGVPASLDQVFAKMMAKQPEERFASMAEVVRALENLAIAAEPLPQQPLPPAARQPETPSPTVAVPPGAPDAANQTIQFAPAPAQPPIPTVAVTPGPQAAANQTVALAPARDPGTGGALILLVEPSRAQAVIIRKYLQDIGFQEITTASSGQKALELALQARPQVVISAMHLADMTGMQLAQKIGAAAVGSPPGFVLVTSQADAGEANLRSQAGDIVRLPKPFSLEELAQALAVALGSPAEPDALARASGPPSLARRAQTHDRTQSFSRLRVLIVDDSAAARKHVQGVLEGLGLSQFVEAADGARAVAAVAGETFDLIVTDYNMPYMDGRALAGYLKQNPSTASIPIIMVTTETDLGKLAAVRQLGVAAVCDKSFPVQVAREVIDRLVGMP